jgi:hypothetical protein
MHNMPGPREENGAERQDQGIPDQRRAGSFERPPGRSDETRWSYQIDGTGWDAGTDVDYLKELLKYWQDGYDWRKHERSLNQFAHLKTEVDDIGVHFIHERGKGSDPFPLILTHGYPDSFYRGGHFAAMEEPELLAADIRTWFQTFREGNFDRPSR